MRRKDREITDFSRIMAIIEACDCCRLGLVDQNKAYIVPMNFGYEINDEQLCLYFHCAAEGRKMELLPKQAVVSFEMDTNHALAKGETGCEFSFLYQSVMGTGAVKEISEPDEKIHGLQKIMAHYTNKADWEFNGNLFSVTKVLKLSVSTLSCKEHQSFTDSGEAGGVLYQKRSDVL